MGRILDVYFDGPHRAVEVVNRIEGEEQESDALAKFLVQWEKDHPIAHT